MSQRETASARSSWLFPLDFSSGGEVELLEADPSALRREPFHDRRLRGRYRDAGTVPLAELERAHCAASISCAPPRYIFHHGFALSTLLSRWLDRPGETFVLREPSILTRLSELQLRDPAGFARPHGRRVLEAVLRLLCRTERPHELTLIKGCDSLTGMIGALLDLDRAARGVLLYTDLDTFVLSCLKDPARHVWARDRTHAFDAWQALPAPLDRLPRTAAEASARLWAQQLGSYRALLHAYPGRLSPIYAERLLSDPTATLREVGRELELPGTWQPPRDTNTHAKTGRPYDAAQRADERAALARIFAAELAEARAFLGSAAHDYRLITRL